MKRILPVVGIVVGLAALGLTGALASTPGQPSNYCSDGSPVGQEHDITTAPHTAYEVVTNYNGYTWVDVCYSTTPKGSSSPEATGGDVLVMYHPTGNESEFYALCRGDRTAATVATIDCSNYVETTDDANSSTVGGSASGTSSFGAGPSVGFGRTGADVAVPTTTVSATGAQRGAQVASGPGTCMYANGTPVYCPGASNLAGAFVAPGDASATVVTRPGGCLTVGSNPCVATVPNGGVVVGKGDSTNNTVSSTVLGTPVNQDLGGCYGYNMGPC